MSSKEPIPEGLLIWREVMDYLMSLESQLTKVWPSELPPESKSETSEFWFTACKLEMATRDKISSKLSTFTRGETIDDFSPIEGWLVRRRLEWAGQLALGYVQEKRAWPSSLQSALDYLLVSTWAEHGCIGMWNHAERDGLPHPDNLLGA